MMWTAAVVAVFVSGSSEDPSAAQAAMRAALSLENTVVFSSGAPSPDDAAVFGSRVGASVVAIVAWDTGHGSARLRVLRAPQIEWVERHLTFDAADVEVERARAVGFAILSMLPSNEPTPPPASPAEPPPDVRDKARGAPVPWMIDVGALGALGLGGDASALGVVLGGRAFVRGPLFVHGGLSARRGGIASAQTSTTFASGAGGAGYTRRLGSRWLLGARADLLLQYLHFSRVSARGDESATRWVPGMQLVGEAGLRLTEHALLRAGLGGELAFGSTDVVVGGRPAGKVPLARTLLELGVALEF